MLMDISPLKRDSDQLHPRPHFLPAGDSIARSPPRSAANIVPRERDTGPPDVHSPSADFEIVTANRIVLVMTQEAGRSRES